MPLLQVIYPQFLTRLKPLVTVSTSFCLALLIKTSKTVTLTSVICCTSYCTRMYPMALICLSPLSPPCVASFPHELVSSGYPPVPNPIRESQEVHTFSLFPRIPILALEDTLKSARLLKPSLLQFCCREESEPRRSFHKLRPSEVGRYWPSPISEYRESACLLIEINFLPLLVSIPRQILEKGVLQ